MKKKNNFYLVIALVLSIGYPSKSWGLPAYRRLVQQQYGVILSCTMCHSKDGSSALNPYGKDFLRNGANTLALTRIESKDSDRDGFSNVIEIQSRSNPGDSFSFPEKPGDWLSHIEESAIPIRELKAGFVDADGFTVLEGTLKPAQIKTIESVLNTSLLDEDKVPIFYFSVKKIGQKQLKYGVAQFLRHEKFTLLVGINLKSEVVFVTVVSAQDRELKFNTSFFKQFIGKTSADPLQVGKDILPIPGKIELSKEIAQVIRKNNLEIKEVFSKP